MKHLDGNQILAIQAAREEGIVNLSESMLEKDVLVRDVIATVCRAGDALGAQIIFCGGTALSQAHCVIDRMSEDADFRIVVPDDVTGQGPKRRFLSSVKAAIEAAVTQAGFPLDGEMKGRNGNEYIMGQFAYQSAFAGQDEALRPHIKLEITAFNPISPINLRPLRTILDRIGVPQEGGAPAPVVPVVSIADTVADKVVGYLRRTAQDQAGLGRGAYDDRLVRHLYDIYHIVERAPKAVSIDHIAPLLAGVVARDQATYGNQFPAFRENHWGILQETLNAVATDPATRNRYDHFCRAMIWGATPAFQDVAARFTQFAGEALGRAQALAATGGPAVRPVKDPTLRGAHNPGISD